MDPRAGLDGCEKSRRHQDSTLGPVQSVASRYKDCAIAPHASLSKLSATAQHALV